MQVMAGYPKAFRDFVSLRELQLVLVALFLAEDA